MKKATTVMLVATLFIGSVLSSHVYADSVTEKKNQLEYVKSQIKLSEQAIQQINNQASEAQVEMQKIDKLVMDTENEIARIQEGIKQKEESLMYLDYQKEVLTDKLTSAKEKFYSLSYSTTDGQDYLDWIGDVDSLDSINYRIDHMNSVYNIYDMALNHSRTERVQSKAKEGTFILERNQLEKDRQVVEKKKMFIQDQLSKKAKALESLNAKKGAFENDVASLEQTSVQLEDIIKNLQASPKSYKGTYKKETGGKLEWPSPVSTRITSTFGYRNDPTGKNHDALKNHTGLDIAASSGTPVVAAEDGIVITSGWLNGYGYTVIIDHGDGLSTLYGHNSKLVAKSGDEVKRGQEISKVGSTGWSTGPHIHFEVRVNGKTVDPQKGWL